MTKELSPKARKLVSDARKLDTKIARDALLAIGDELVQNGQPHLGMMWYKVAANTNANVLASLRRMMK